MKVVHLNQEVQQFPCELLLVEKLKMIFFPRPTKMGAAEIMVVAEMLAEN